MKNRILSLVVALALVLSLVPATSASAGVTEVTDAAEHTSTITVTATVGSAYYVEVPATLAFTQEAVTVNATNYTYKAEGTIGVKGNIPSNQRVYVNIPSTMTLRDLDGAGSVEVTAALSLSKDKWTQSDLIDGGVVKTTYTESTLTAGADFVSAGSYSGDLTVAFGLEANP